MTERRNTTLMGMRVELACMLETLIPLEFMICISLQNVRSNPVTLNSVISIFTIYKAVFHGSNITASRVYAMYVQ